MDNVGWKYLNMYIAMICVEIATIYFFYPETQGRTLEELAFCKNLPRSVCGAKLTRVISVRGRHPE